MNVFVADDHPIFLEGLIQVIGRNPEIRIVGQANDGQDAWEKISRLQPDVCILDISMPGMNGLEIVKRVKIAGLTNEFIILTMYKDEEYFNEALDLGVKGYMLKENAVSDVLNCLQKVYRGEYFVSAEISRYLINRNQRQKKLFTEYPDLQRLTPTEKKILGLIARNKTSREIAEILFISFRTVQNHRNHICQKLGLRGHNKLLQFAIENKSRL